MNKIILEKYLTKMRNLSVKITKGIKAPHKAVMLITIMDFIKEGKINSNKIYITDEIANTFQRNWDAFIGNNKIFSSFICSPWTPFWHLKQDGFWHFRPLISLTDIETLAPKGQTASVGRMRSVIKYAYLDAALYEILQDSVYRSKISEILFDTYINQGENNKGENNKGENKKLIEKHHPMSKLEELYEIKDKLLDLGIEPNTDLEYQLSELEKEIITSEIVPMIAENIESVLKLVRHEMEFVVKYNPIEGVSVHPLH